MVARPDCPSCGRPSILTDDRFGGKYECPDCDMWAWGGKPLRSREENNALRKGQGRPRKTVVNLSGLGDDPEWAAVLGVSYPATMRQVNRAYRKATLTAHPDRGGTVEDMDRLAKAKAEAKAEIEGVLADAPVKDVWEL